MILLETMKRRIRSAQDMQSIVHTMRSFAAVNITQYESAARASEDYLKTVLKGLEMLRWLHPQKTIPEQTGSVQQVGMIIYGSDQGMCGSFNEQITTYVHEMISSGYDKQQVRIQVVGSRAADLISDHGYEIDALYEVPSSVNGISNLTLDLLPNLETWLHKYHLKTLIQFHNVRIRKASWEPSHSRVLPFELDEVLPEATSRWDSRSLPMITIDPENLYRELVHQYLFVMLYRAVAHSLAGENASRIASMQAAEKNIGERLDELQKNYQLGRQEAITEELLDVITGFEALQNSPQTKKRNHQHE